MNLKGMGLTTLRGLLVALLLSGCLGIAQPGREANQGAQSPAITRPTSPAAIPPGAIEALEAVVLGGVEQWILIRGLDRTKPVLLWLHGGPGSPAMPLAHHYDAELIKHFVVVHWDQRGAGKSYDGALTAEILTVDQFVSDTYELAQYLRERLAVPKLYLVGHSWGSELGALTAARYPELFHAFVGVGQAVALPEGYKVGYEWLLAEAQRTNNAEAQAELETLGPPPWQGVEPLGVFGKWNAIFGGILRNIDPEQLNQTQQASPFYTAADWEKTTQGGAFSVGAMLGEIMAVDLFVQAPRLEVPVYIFQGRHDRAAPAAVAERYFQALDAPQGKEMIWFEESAHFPMYEEPAKFAHELLRVLAETHSGETDPVSTALPTPAPTVAPPPTATAPTVNAGIERVNFDPGATSATRRGQLTPGALQQYVLRTLAGQKMAVQANGFSAPVYLIVTGPDGVKHPAESLGSEIYIFLTEVMPTLAGDYTVELRTPVDGVTTDFEIHFEITDRP